MKKLDPKQPIDVGALTRALIARTITMPRFKFPADEEQTFAMLFSCYQAEVVRRGCIFIDNAEVRNNLLLIAKALTTDNNCFGILLCGTCGNGKTSIMFGFQNLIAYLIGKGFIDSQFKGLRIMDAVEVFELAKNKDFRETVSDLPMLGIEDMGREPTDVVNYGNYSSPLVNLLEYRYHRQLFTFITTNLNANDITGKYGTRIADRFREMVNIIPFKNATFRKKRELK